MRTTWYLLHQLIPHSIHSLIYSITFLSLLIAKTFGLPLSFNISPTHILYNTPLYDQSTPSLYSFFAILFSHPFLSNPLQPFLSSSVLHYSIHSCLLFSFLFGIFSSLSFSIPSPHLSSPLFSSGLHYNPLPSSHLFFSSTPPPLLLPRKLK